MALSDWQFVYNGSTAYTFGDGTNYPTPIIDGLEGFAAAAFDLPAGSGWGATKGRDKVEPRVITFAIWVPNTAVDNVLDLLKPEPTQERTLQFKVPHRSGEQIVYCRPRRVAPIRDVGSDYAVSATKIAVEFHASDPRIYAATAGSQAITISGTGTSQAGTVTTTGAQRTPATLTIGGPAVTPKVLNASDSSRYVQFDSTLAAARTLTVDMKAHTASDDLGNDWMQYLNANSQWWDLASGANSVTYSRASGASSSTCTVGWRDASI